MTNPMLNPQPNYSGVTIQIANPAVNVGQYTTQPQIPQGIIVKRGNYSACPQACYYDSNNAVGSAQTNKLYPSQPDTSYNTQASANTVNQKPYDAGYAQAYPAQYYLNNYNTNSQNPGLSDVPENGYYNNYANANSDYNSQLPASAKGNLYTNNQINRNPYFNDSAQQNIYANPDYAEQAFYNNQNQISPNNRYSTVPLDSKNSSNSFINGNQNEFANNINNNSGYQGNTDNNFNHKYNTNPDSMTKPYIAGENFNLDKFGDENNYLNNKNHVVDPEAGISPYKDYAKSITPKQPEDMTASKNIIENLNERNAEIKEAKKNTKETKIVALTDEYIKSLENYLNNPNDEIRLMASKEILTRLDEDKDRYDDAALNALLNKMLQDPSKLIRLAALSAFASQLACGNEYTIQLLQNIQSNPNADKEDALQAADILLKMSAGVEVKNIPNSDVKREKYIMKQREQ